LAKESEERDEGTRVVLVCARDRGLGLYCGLSTVTARWRPAGARGSRGARGAGQRGRAIAAGKVGVTRGEEESRRWTAATMTERRLGGELCVGGRTGEAEVQKGLRGRR
jgi:hypothetical protein